MPAYLKTSLLDLEAAREQYCKIHKFALFTLRTTRLSQLHFRAAENKKDSTHQGQIQKFEGGGANFKKNNGHTPFGHTHLLVH